MNVSIAFQEFAFFLEICLPIGYILTIAVCFAFRDLLWEWKCIELQCTVIVLFFLLCCHTFVWENDKWICYFCVLSVTLLSLTQHDSNL